jgi:hypothetical protein
MPREQLKRALSALQQELESNEQMGPDDRAALLRTAEEIDQALERTSGGGDSDAPGPLARRVSSLIEEFETSHPQFAEILRNVSESLANLGI